MDWPDVVLAAQVKMFPLSETISFLSLPSKFGLQFYLRQTAYLGESQTHDFRRFV